MTLRYVRSGAGGSADGTSWANAFLTVKAALLGSSAGDTIYVSEDHAESNALDMTHTSPGTAAAPVNVICVDHAGSVPPVTADIRNTATVTTTTGKDISFSGSHIRYKGITFTAGSAGGTANIYTSSSADQSVRFKDCALRLGAGAANNSTIVLGTSSSGGSLLVLENTSLQFTHVSQLVRVGDSVKWINSTLVTGSVFPTTLFKGYGGNASMRFEMRGVDLSMFGSGTTLFDMSATGMVEQYIYLLDCKIDAAVTLAVRPAARGGGKLEYLRVDSGGTDWKHGLINYEGTLTSEGTIVLTGGASDGVHSMSWKMVTTANSNEFFPFESPAIEVWTDTVGSPVTATIEGVWGGGAVPNNDDIWIEAEYLGASGSPQASFITDAKADLAASAGHTSSSATWGGSTTKFKMNVTFTPQQAGWVFLRVNAAKPSSTFYVDTKPVLS